MGKLSCAARLTYSEGLRDQLRIAHTWQAWRPIVAPGIHGLWFRETRGHSWHNPCNPHSSRGKLLASHADSCSLPIREDDL